MFKILFSKIKFDKYSDRLGPDLPFTHWRLFFKPLMKKLCRIKFMKFDENSDFRPNAYAIHCSKISIGKNVVIRPHTMLFADIRTPESGLIFIEDNVLIGSGVHVYTSNHNYINPDLMIIEQGHFDALNTVVKKGAWIGANAILLPGVTIGLNSVVGAGSIVTKSVDDFTVVAGNPAKVIKKVQKNVKK